MYIYQMYVMTLSKRNIIKLESVW